MSDLVDDEGVELALLLEAVQHRFHYDFREYSRASLRRRFKLALQRFECESFSQLQHRIFHDDINKLELLNCLTIQVSDLFRDPDYYRALRAEVLPHLSTYPSLNIWVAGCASGEELYSLAILLREEGLADKTILHATDINETALQQAKKGVFDLNRFKGFTRNYQLAGGSGSLSDYYTAAYGAARLDPSLKDNVVFAHHNLATDAAFAEMHLISCRNVLIYFNRGLQGRVAQLFESSLIRRGFLGLGTRESLRFSGVADHFVLLNESARLYQLAGGY